MFLKTRFLRAVLPREKLLLPCFLSLLKISPFVLRVSPSNNFNKKQFYRLRISGRVYYHWSAVFISEFPVKMLSVLVSSRGSQKKPKSENFRDAGKERLNGKTRLVKADKFVIYKWNDNNKFLITRHENKGIRKITNRGK